MYSLNARDHFNCSPLLFAWPALGNRCCQTQKWDTQSPCRHLYLFISTVVIYPTVSVGCKRNLAEAARPLSIAVNPSDYQLGHHYTTHARMHKLNKLSEVSNQPYARVSELVQISRPSVRCQLDSAWKADHPCTSSLVHSAQENCTFSLPFISTTSQCTSCAGAATIRPRPSPPSAGAEASRAAEPTAPDHNVAVGSHGEYVPTVTAAAAWYVNAAVSKAAWRPWPFDLESGVRVTCDVGYLCVNFSLPRPLCSRLRPDVRVRQTDRRQTASLLNAPRIRGGA